MVANVPATIYSGGRMGRGITSDESDTTKIFAFLMKRRELGRR